MENEVMKSGDYALMALFFFTGILWLPQSLGAAAAFISVGLVCLVVAIFNYKQYMNRSIYWILVLIILFTIFIPFTFIFVPPPTENLLLKYSPLCGLFVICILIAYIKMQKLEKKFNSNKID
jgi:hypothetical protein